MGISASSRDPRNSSFEPKFSRCREIAFGISTGEWSIRAQKTETDLDAFGKASSERHNIRMVNVEATNEFAPLERKWEAVRCKLSVCSM